MMYVLTRALLGTWQVSRALMSWIFIYSCAAQKACPPDLQLVRKYSQLKGVSESRANRGRDTCVCVYIYKHEKGQQAPSSKGRTCPSPSSSCQYRLCRTPAILSV